MSTTDTGSTVGHALSLLVFVATACGIGRLRRAPGTWASIAAGLAALALLPHIPSAWMGLVVMAVALATALVGFLVCPAAVRHFGAADPSAVVIDEVAGVWWALAILPVPLLTDATGPAVILAVAAFRVFDIAKPWPVGSLERLPGPAAIMADDLAAGILAGLVTTALLY